MFRCDGFFLRFRERVAKGYPSLFRTTTDEQGLSDFSETAQFTARWGWYQSLYSLAKGDVTKFDEVTKLPALMALTYLEFEAQKTEIENRKLKK